MTEGDPASAGFFSFRYNRTVPVITCERCGYEWTVNSIRRNSRFCTSCRARKVQTVHTKQGKCIPWHGRFAEDQITPIDDEGNLVLPGIRACLHDDCVAPSHIIPDVSG